MMSETKAALAELEKSVFARFSEKRRKSEQMYHRARNSLVAGVSGSVRYFPPYPLYFSHGQGSTITDIDGNDYVDCVLGNGSLLLGHRHPEVLASLRLHEHLGTMMMNPELIVDVAEQVVSSVPSAQQVRFVNSGTEAVMIAMRIARAVTGRDTIVKISGAYHGQADTVLIGLDPSKRPPGAGIPSSSQADMVVLGMDDVMGLEEVLSGGGVAAVLLDPSMHHTGLWAGSSEQYRQLQQRARAAGALLICDEVIAGFRLAKGGGQEHFSLEPDISVFAKALAAGERLGVVAGSEEVMRVADPSLERQPGPFAFQSGTNNDATGGLAAARGALAVYESEAENGGYLRMHELGQRLADGLKRLFAERDMDVHCNQLGPMVKLILASNPKGYGDRQNLNAKARTLFHLALAGEGVFTIPGSNDFFLSFAHTEIDVESVLERAACVLDRFDFRRVLDA